MITKWLLSSTSFTSVMLREAFNDAKLLTMLRVMSIIIVEILCWEEKRKEKEKKERSKIVACR